MSKIDITSLSDKEKQALVCMFFARMPNSDPRYKKRFEYWQILEGRYNRKVATYKNDKDTFDACFSTNGRKGWQYTDIEKRNKVFKPVLEQFADVEDAELEEAVDEIIDSCKNEGNVSSFVSLRMQKPEQVHSVLNDTEGVFTIDDIYTIKEKFSLDRIVFVALGGDQGLSSVDWDKGFYGIAKVVKEPYNVGYKTGSRGQSYYKVDLKMLWYRYPPMTKEELMEYPDTFDAPFIGLEIHRDPTQAVAQLEDNKAVAIVRAVLDRYPNDLDKIKNVFNPEFMERVTGFVRRLVNLDVDYGQSIKDALEERIIDVEKHQVLNEDERLTEGTNILYYGIPGSGKSYKIDQAISNDNFRVRVIFHPEYTYSDFVGQIRPVLVDDKVKYDFVPGPFTDILKEAYWNPSHMYYFIIEEINRGNAAAIFGDTFQLLDRDCEGNSQYGIKNSDVAKHVYGDSDHKIKIPSNLTILATMNTSDQNVFTLDTAFQRRWEMEHIPNNFDSELHKLHVANEIESGITWYAFAKIINEAVVKLTTNYGMSEDKQLGVYFAKGDSITNKRKFAEKVLKYLWDDAVKIERSIIFNTDKVKTFEAVVNAHIENGLREVLKNDLYNAILNCNLPDYPHSVETEEE